MAGQSVTVDLAYRVGSSVGTIYHGKPVLVGRDGRTSSLTLAEAVVGGLLAQGNDVEDCGLVTTPGLQFLVKEAREVSGVMVTASHNPAEYNGFKVVDSDGIEIPRGKEERIEKLIHRNSWKISKRPGVRSQRQNPLEPYLAEVRKRFERAGSLDRVRVAVDAGNGVASLTTPVLLRQLGCHVVTLNDNIDGSFPGRDSEPRRENLGALVALVRSEKADFGVAHDGDGDRAMFVDETGTVHQGDRTLTLIEDEVLKKNPGAKVVTPINTSMAVTEVARKRHGELIVTKVGSIHVARTMVREKAILGGEENGGIFYAAHQPVRDGTMATVLVLQAIVGNKLPLSKLIARLPKFFMAKEKIPCAEKSKKAAIIHLKRELGKKVSSTLDGVRVDLKNRGWFLVRPSGTEPLIRVYVEGKTQSDLDKILGEYKPLILESLGT